MGRILHLNLEQASANVTDSTASMADMTRLRGIFLILLWAATPTSMGLARAPGQGNQEDAEQAQRRAEAEAAQREQQQRGAAEEERKARELSIERMKEFQRDVAADVRREVDQAAFRREVQRRQRFEEFRNALSDFAIASATFRESLGVKTVKRPASTMAKSSDTFLDYIKLLTKERASLDTSEFRNFSEKEVAWETLTTAERVFPQLESILVSEDHATVDVDFLQSLSKLQKDLLRLQWMARRIK